METNVAVLVDAKNEYTKQLVQLISPHLLSGLLTIYDEAYGVCTANKEEDLTMLTFQELLGEVPAWNNVMVAEETERIMDESKCDYLEDLLTAVFVCHTKILTTVRVTNKDRKINLKIPSVENFVHQVYIEMARSFWKHPYLLNPSDVSKLDYQHNLQVAEQKVSDCLEATVRKLLPVKDILKEYLADDDADDYDVESSKSNPDEMASESTGSVCKVAGGSGAKETVAGDKGFKDKLKDDVEAFKIDSTVHVTDATNLTGGGSDAGKPTNVQSGGGNKANDPFASMMDAVAAKSSMDASSGGDVKVVSLDKGVSASNLSVTTPTLNVPAVSSPLSPTTTGSTELSLDSLTGGGTPSALGSPTTTGSTGLSLDSIMAKPTTTTPSSTTTGTSEIALDNLGSLLGNIEEVKVDYGSPRSSAASLPSVNTSVMSQFDKVAGGSTVPTTASASVPAPAPAPVSHSFW